MQDWLSNLPENGSEKVEITRWDWDVVSQQEKLARTNYICVNIIDQLNIDDQARIEVRGDAEYNDEYELVREVCAEFAKKGYKTEERFVYDYIEFRVTK